MKRLAFALVVLAAGCTQTQAPDAPYIDDRLAPSALEGGEPVEAPFPTTEIPDIAASDASEPR